MSEKFYDEEIAPALMELANKCGKHGMSMVCVVEYEKEEAAVTQHLTSAAGLGMIMQAFCAHAGTNLDSYVISLARYARKHGIDCSTSMVLSQFVPGGEEIESRVKPQAE